MKRITTETKIKIYNLMLLDYEKQLSEIRANRERYTAAEYRKETGILYNLIAQAKKQLSEIITE